MECPSRSASKTTADCKCDDGNRRCIQYGTVLYCAQVQTVGEIAVTTHQPSPEVSAAVKCYDSHLLIISGQLLALLTLSSSQSIPLDNIQSFCMLNVPFTTRSIVWYL